LFRNYAYESVDNEVKSYFPEYIAEGVKIEYESYSISLTPAITSIQDSTRNSKKSVANKRENSVLYEETFNSNVSLEYAPSLNGVKENIIINKYDGVNTFEFTINTDGLIPAKLEGDSIPLIDPDTDEMKFFIGQINARDSYLGANENNDTHFTLYNSLKLEETTIENVYKLIVIVDKEFLESETTVYPVTVDPTITISSSNVADAPVYSGYPNTNFYTNEYNMVGYHGSSYKEAMTFVKLNSLSSYKYVNPEKINLAYYRVYEGSGKTSTATVNLHDTLNTWNESTITYSNKPAIVSEYESTNTISSSGWYLFSITDLFTNWLRSALNEGGFSPNYGFALVASTTGVSSRHFCSANSTNFLPSIVFNYSEDTSLADGAYYIRSKYSNLYLDTEQDPNANGNVIQYGFHGYDNQVWVIKHQSDGYYKLFSPWYDETKCLDIESNPTQNGSNVDVYDDVDGDYILFKLVSNNDGTYRIISKWSNNQKVLDICGPSTAATANIQIWEYAGVNQQKWYFEPVSNGAAVAYRVAEFGEPRCFSYALEILDPPQLILSPFDTVNTLYEYQVYPYITDMLGRGCRKLSSQYSAVGENEYRIAMRIGIHEYELNDGGLGYDLDYHFIVQTNSGGWAHKQGLYPSEYLGLINLNTRSWDQDSKINFYDSDTIYFAVTR